VEGATLSELIDEKGAVSEELTRHIARQIAQALSALHGAGFVHRDLKPANIILTHDLRIKVMDLGMVRLTDAASALSQFGLFHGSPMYAAPEQFEGQAPDARADWYAVGLILYELATGRHPSGASDLATIMRRRLDEAPAHAREVNPDVSEYLDALLEALLKRDRDQRLDHLPGERSAWWRAQASAGRARETQARSARVRVSLPGMSKDWDAKYRSEADQAARAPVALIARMADMLPRSGRALDIAAGAGRNAVCLAEMGLTVDAVDLSAEGLRQATELAAERGVSIHTIVADLASFDPGEARYDVVTNFYYLQRDLVPRLRRSVRPGGLVLFETYTMDQLTRRTGPCNAEFLLRPGELEAMFEGFEILLYEETETERKAIASLVARRPE